jgi:hypothetical protein
MFMRKSNNGGAILRPSVISAVDFSNGANLSVKTRVSTFALSRSPTFKLSTTGPRSFFLLHGTSVRPLTPSDELCDLTGQMVG